MIMSTPPDTDLGLKDIRFLKAIRDISENPEKYPHTDTGKVPATKTALREATELDEDSLRYRLRTDRSKLAEDGGAGYIRIRSPTVNDDGSFGPKSVELTDEGYEVLEAELEERDLVMAGVQHGEQSGEQGGSGELEAAVATLEERLASVEAKLDRVLELVNEWESSSTGALDPDQTRALQAMTDAVPAHDRALKALGVEGDEITDAEELDPDAVRQQVQATLLEAEGQPAGQRDQETAGGTSERKQDGGQVNLDNLQGDTE